MIKFFQNFFCKIKYKNSDGWCNICEIDDSDMKIIVYRLFQTNNLEFHIFDKVPNKNEYIFRESFTSKGNPKYATMPGFSDLIECQNVDLDELIQENE